MNQKPKTYLCGPIGLNVIRNAKEWRQMVKERLSNMCVIALDPFDNIGNSLQNVRTDLHTASDEGDIEGARYIVSKYFIPPDLKMVKTSNFLTVYIPEKDDYEICGSYGEATLAAFFHKPVYIVTDRILKPITLPHWLVGCSTEIFTNWEDYFKFVEKEWGSK